MNPLANSLTLFGERNNIFYFNLKRKTILKSFSNLTPGTTSKALSCALSNHASKSELETNDESQNHNSLLWEMTQ